MKGEKYRQKGGGKMKEWLRAFWRTSGVLAFFVLVSLQCTG